MTDNRLVDYLEHVVLAASQACAFAQDMGKDQFEKAAAQTVACRRHLSLLQRPQPPLLQSSRCAPPAWPGFR